ncbi:DegT/DnrJ/EryC1/StrS family aminotransferase [Fodinibius saliphilus]|uniref:DegT/DnrJ/EryC1/StrS family aminotransferase n=1 Tax=Fodinibius saliphilus TaxID=1920650 RepID=UPI00110891FA|nr:aminotransferase class I/II-fold pyridoxal phosphate-dependent enzyme [Fodinibius saliphilus]
MDYSANRIYLSPPHMGGQEEHYIRDAFNKNWIAPMGENVDGFEQDLQEYTNRNEAAAVSSGTAAIHLALILCDVGLGDEVICQSFTFTASANPIRYQGATPIFIDSEPVTWNMDPQLLEKAILDRMEKGVKPKAIILVHLYGMPAKVDRILAVAGKYDIPVIEDAAEAMGSAVEHYKCGGFGLLSIFSFNGNKIITTSGGGALLSDDRRLIRKGRFLATQARDEAPHYQHSQLGYNYRMSNIVAGIGRGQMQVLDEHVKARRANHAFYFEQLEGVWLEEETLQTMQTPAFTGAGTSKGIYFLREPAGYFSNRWLTTILVNPEETGGVTATDIRLALEEKNIESRPLWKPMHLQPLYRSCKHYENGVSEKLFELGLCLPSGSNLSNRERLRVVSVIRKTLRDVHYE